MGKEILFDIAARDRIKKGVDKLADAVKATLGPRGRNVILGREYGSPSVTKDGVTVARNIELDDLVENIGAQLVKEVASKTADVAGDGTTTATVLAQAIYSHGIKNVAAGANPMDLKYGIDKAVIAVVKSIRSQSKDVSTTQQIAQVGTISSNNDAEVGRMISEAMDKVGKDGAVTVEEGKGTETEVKIVEGMQFMRGFLSPYFVTNTAKMEVEMESPLILIYANKISAMKEMIPILETVARASKPLLIIAEDVDGEALATLVVNKIRGSLRVAAVKSPGFGDRRKAILEDIAVLTGGKVISEELGIRLDDAKLEHLGRADKVNVGRDMTTIVNGAGRKIDITERVEQIKLQIEECTVEAERVNLKDRLARLSGGVAILYVGAATEVEMKEKKDRVEDALYATRAAVQEGIIPGGGVAYIRAIQALKGVEVENEDQATGVNIIRLALESPIRTIAANAGQEGSVVVNKVSEGTGDFGYNARENKYQPFFEAGIIDPTKVARLALENAASIAGLLLTTEVVVADRPKPPAPEPVAS